MQLQKRTHRLPDPDVTLIHAPQLTPIRALSGGPPPRALTKYHLSQLASETGLEIHVCHFPPGTSKWNKIEHRMFSYISKNWRGRPLESIRTIIDLISNTTTETGLTIKAQYDPSIYEKGIKFTTEQMAAIKLVRDTWHGEWNYKILPQ